MQIKRKYFVLLILLLVLVDAFLLYWSAEPEVSEATIKEIVYEDTFRSWSFEEQLELAVSLQKITIGEPIDFEAMSEKPLDYLVDFVSVVKEIDKKNRTDVRIPTLHEIYVIEDIDNWSDQESGDLINLFGDDREKRMSDFSLKTQRVVITYITIMKNRVLEAVIETERNQTKNNISDIRILM